MTTLTQVQLESDSEMGGPLMPDAQLRDSTMGHVILIDRLTNVAPGAAVLGCALPCAGDIHWQDTDVDKAARRRKSGHGSAVVWLTGLSGAGMSTLANLREKRLHTTGKRTYVLDGDNLRHGLNKDLGFSVADRVENIRRVAEVARMLVDAGCIVITAFISPFRADRKMARELMEPGEFIEVFVDTPLDVAEQRDPKGLYRKARRGELKNFTGIDSPYERPDAPEIVIDTTRLDAPTAAALVHDRLTAMGLLHLA